MTVPMGTPKSSNLGPFDHFINCNLRFWGSPISKKNAHKHQPMSLLVLPGFHGERLFRHRCQHFLPYLQPTHNQKHNAWTQQPLIRFWCGISSVDILQDRWKAVDPTMCHGQTMRMMWYVWFIPQLESIEWVQFPMTRP